MLRLLAVAALFAVVATAAYAQEGSYSGSGEGDLTAVIQAPDYDGISTIDLSTSTPIEDGIGGCSGEVSGSAILSETGGTFYASNDDYDPADATTDEYCEVTMTFKKGKLVIEEASGCLAYHGAACSFTGELRLDSGAN
jgi:hypothetical protein